jgi:hypothetical protein
MIDDATILRKNFARYLAPMYLENPIKIACDCDEDLDRTGALLGYVRLEAAKLKTTHSAGMPIGGQE